MKHSKPVEHLKHLEHLQHLKILKCPSVKHFQVLNRFKMKILSPALNDTVESLIFSVGKEKHFIQIEPFVTLLLTGQKWKDIDDNGCKEA